MKKDKKSCILKYVQENLELKDFSSLGFKPIKTKEYFKEAYDMHDIASEYVIQKYSKLGYRIIELGVDLRDREVQIENDVPDYIAETDKDLFCFDIKSKTSIGYFGWVNKRAVKHYRKLAECCDVQIYIIFVEINKMKKEVTGRIGYCSIYDEIIKDNHKAWDGNWVVIYKWKEGLPTI